jgi:O-antigen/teichoic acid export membrane protein
MTVAPESEDRPGAEIRSRGAETAHLGRRIALNTVLNVLGRFVSIVGWTLIAPFMLARLGVERFGLWSLITVVSGLYLTFDLGLSHALTKFVAEFRASGDRRSLRGIFTMGIAFFSGLGLLMITVIVLFRGPLVGFFHVGLELRDEADWALVGAAVVYALLNAYTLMSSVLSGLQRLDLWNRISILVTLLQLLGVWLVLSLGFGIRGLVVNTGIVLAIGTLVCWMVVRRLAPEIGIDSSSPSRPLWHRLKSFGAALQIINLGILVQFQLDKVLFARFVSLGAVASYEFAFRLMSALWALPSLLLPPLVPAVAHLDALAEGKRIARLYRRASRYVVTLAFPLAGGAILLAPRLFFVWLGPGHADAVLATRALAALMCVNILTGVGSSVVRGVGRPRLEAEYHVLSMVLHGALSLVLIPRFGFAGGLVALFVSGAFGSLYFVWRLHRFLGESTVRFVIEVLAWPLAAAIVATAVTGLLWGMGDTDASRVVALAELAGAGVVFAATVAALLLLSRYLSLAEIRELASMIRGGRPAPLDERGGS